MWTVDCGLWTVDCGLWMLMSFLNADGTKGKGQTTVVLHIQARMEVTRPDARPMAARSSEPNWAAASAKGERQNNCSPAYPGADGSLAS